VTSMHSNKLFKCKQCHKILSTKGHLKRHINSFHKVHGGSGTTPKCYFCASDGRQKFTDNCDVFNHMRGVHLYEYPFKCRKNSWCTRKFSNTDKARVHIKCVRVEVNKSKCPVQVKWDCYFCAKQFNGQSHLSNHLSSRHTYEKPFRCNFCYAEFNQNCKIQEHIAFKHTRELSYTCKYCDFRATASWQLSWHCKKIHKTGLLYVCNICKATCESIAHLCVHMKLHKHTNSFVCYFCAKVYNKQYLMFQHMKRKHLHEAYY